MRVCVCVRMRKIETNRKTDIEELRQRTLPHEVLAKVAVLPLQHAQTPL